MWSGQKIILLEILEEWLQENTEVTELILAVVDEDPLVRMKEKKETQSLENKIMRPPQQ